MSRCWLPEVFFDPVAWDGSDFVPGSAGDIDQRVLNNSIALGMLALCIWVAAGFGLGAQGLGICVALALGFVVARGCFWYGYHRALTLRAFGFAASFIRWSLFCYGLQRHNFSAFFRFGDLGKGQHAIRSSGGIR
jgi:hypothetical protein